MTIRRHIDSVLSMCLDEGRGPDPFRVLIAGALATALRSLPIDTPPTRAGTDIGSGSVTLASAKDRLG